MELFRPMTASALQSVRETLKSLEPITRGHYMGETDLFASPTRAAESLAPGRKAVAASLCDAHHEPLHRYMPPET
jgi:hypothetical protein